MNREELLQRIREICYNSDEDIFRLDEWSSLNVQELRTVVGILDNGGAAMIFDNIPPRVRGHCYLLRHLVRHLQMNPSANNPHTGRPITPRQREIIENAYFRITGQRANIRPSIQTAPAPQARRSRPPRIVAPPNNNRATAIPESGNGAAVTPQAPRIPGSAAANMFFPPRRMQELIPESGGGGGPPTQTQRPVAARDPSIGSEMRQQFQGTTIINVNGQRHTAIGAVLSIVRRRINGRDEFTINIEYPRRDH